VFKKQIKKGVGTLRKIISSMIVLSLVTTSSLTLAYAKPSSNGKGASKELNIVETKEKVTKTADTKVTTGQIAPQVKAESVKKEAVKPAENKSVTLKAEIQKRLDRYKNLSKKVPPVIKFGKIVINVNALTKSTKADEVSWDGTFQSLVIKKGDNVIEIINGKSIVVNGTAVDPATLQKVQGSLLPYIQKVLAQKPVTEVPTTPNTPTTPTDGTGTTGTTAPTDSTGTTGTTTPTDSTITTGTTTPTDTTTQPAAQDSTATQPDASAGTSNTTTTDTSIVAQTTTTQDTTQVANTNGVN
jgi:hypothetical protein